MAICVTTACWLSGWEAEINSLLTADTQITCKNGPSRHGPCCSAASPPNKQKQNIAIKITPFLSGSSHTDLQADSLVLWYKKVDKDVFINHCRLDKVETVSWERREREAEPASITTATILSQPSQPLPSYTSGQCSGHTGVMNV